MQRPITLAQNPDFSDIQPGVGRDHIAHALLAYPTRIRCLEGESGTLVLSARVASPQEEIEYGVSKEDL